MIPPLLPFTHRAGVAVPVDEISLYPLRFGDRKRDVTRGFADPTLSLHCRPVPAVCGHRAPSSPALPLWRRAARRCADCRPTSRRPKDGRRRWPPTSTLVAKQNSARLLMRERSSRGGSYRTAWARFIWARRSPFPRRCLAMAASASGSMPAMRRHQKRRLGSARAWRRSTRCSTPASRAPRWSAPLPRHLTCGPPPTRRWLLMR